MKKTKTKTNKQKKQNKKLYCKLILDLCKFDVPFNIILQSPPPLLEYISPVVFRLKPHALSWISSFWLVKAWIDLKLTSGSIRLALKAQRITNLFPTSAYTWRRRYLVVVWDYHLPVCFSIELYNKTPVSLRRGSGVLWSSSWGHC